MAISIQQKNTLLGSLPSIDATISTIYPAALKEKKADTIIVLDDDPTGTQTVHGVPVLTDWSKESILREFEQNTPLFYILTNSRSLTQEDTIQLTRKIGQHIKSAAIQTDTQYWIISRSDSTLRGHYPTEIEALEFCLPLEKSVQFLIPAFFEGGRYTINDIHYVEQEDHFIPAAQTIYAKDHVFGYQSSDLKDWILEKSRGKVSKEQISSISIQMLRTTSVESLTQQLDDLAPNSICIINAADYADLHTFSAALCKSSIQPVFRTAASFVASIAGIDSLPLLGRKDILRDSKNGGLIIVGSYVDTTTRQLQYLLKEKPGLAAFEIDIPTVLKMHNLNLFIEQLIGQIEQSLLAGQSAVLFTSRKLVSAVTEQEKQQIAQKVSSILTAVVQGIRVHPSFLLSKGGITSSDIATKGLGIKRAIVLGQVLKGVPVWKLGPETKFPGSVQIIFPGNVGQDTSLVTIVDNLQS
ncbi:MAG: four-carbon acid sugar kinase family protein [Bacteroidota bacterium]